MMQNISSRRYFKSPRRDFMVLNISSRRYLKSPRGDFTVQNISSRRYLKSPRGDLLWFWHLLEEIFWLFFISSKRFFISSRRFLISSRRSPRGDLMAIFHLLEEIFHLLEEIFHLLEEISSRRFDGYFAISSRRFFISSRRFAAILHLHEEISWRSCRKRSTGNYDSLKLSYFHLFRGRDPSISCLFWSLYRSYHI